MQTGNDMLRWTLKVGRVGKGTGFRAGVPV